MFETLGRLGKFLLLELGVADVVEKLCRLVYILQMLQLDTTILLKSLFVLALFVESIAERVVTNGKGGVLS